MKPSDNENTTQRDNKMKVKQKRKPKKDQQKG
jgi:hypothetical protein